MPIDRQNTPPPTIGKIGRYTVFITPPATPYPQSEPRRSSPDSTPRPQFEQSPRKSESDESLPRKVAHNPVMAPPIQSQMSDKKAAAAAAYRNGSGVVGMFWNAMDRVHHAHSSLDDHLSRWFGLDQSKYQWALDDYYQSKGMGKDDIKMTNVSNKV